MGMLEVRDRLGDTSTFGEDDRRLAEALAAHVAYGAAERPAAGAFGLRRHPRRADRAAQPRAADPSADRGARGRAGRGADRRPRPVRPDQRHPRRRQRRRGAHPGRRSGWSPTRRPERRSPASATTSSACCCPASKTSAESLAMAQMVREALLEPVHVSGLALDGSGAVGVAVVAAARPRRPAPAAPRRGGAAARQGRRAARCRPGAPAWTRPIRAGWP